METGRAADAAAIDAARSEGGADVDAARFERRRWRRHAGAGALGLERLSFCGRVVEVRVEGDAHGRRGPRQRADEVARREARLPSAGPGYDERRQRDARLRARGEVPEPRAEFLGGGRGPAG